MQKLINNRNKYMKNQLKKQPVKNKILTSKDLLEMNNKMCREAGLSEATLFEPDPDSNEVSVISIRRK